MFELNERTTACLLGTFRDEVGSLVPGSALTALTLTILDAESGRVVRAAQSVKNANGGLVYDTLQSITIGGKVRTYNFRLTLTPADGTMGTPPPDWREFETHRAIVVATWGAGKQLVHETLIHVRSLPTA